MARITVEECIAQIPNHFDLTLAASLKTAPPRWWKTPATTNPP